MHVPALVVAAGLFMVGGAADAGFGLYVSNYNANNILDLNQSGGSATFVSSVSGPAGTAFDSSGNFYVASQGSQSILKFSSTGAPLGTFASANISGVEGIAFDSSNNLYVANFNGNSVTEYSSSGTFLKTFATVTGVEGVLIDSKGDVFASGYGNNAVYEYSSAGTLLQTFTGNLGSPSQMVLVGSTLYVSNLSNGAIEKFSTLTGTDLGTFATGAGSGAYGLAYDPTTGIFYQSGYLSGTIQEFSSSGASLGYLATGLSGPYFLTLAGTASAVPEPASLGLMALGLAGATAFARRRRVRRDLP